MKKKQTYEEAMLALEDIVAQLEEGDVPLDKALDLFKKGTELTAFCSKALDTAEQKVRMLSDAEQEEGDNNE